MKPRPRHGRHLEGSVNRNRALASLAGSRRGREALHETMEQENTKSRWPLWVGIFVWLGMGATIALAYVQTFLV